MAKISVQALLQAWEQKHWMRPELIEQPGLMQTKPILRRIPIGQFDANGNFVKIDE